MASKKQRLAVVEPAVIMKVANYSTREAWLLWRIVSWYRYAQVEEGGHLWVVKTQEQWAEDTGFTLHQVRRAMVSLRESGIIQMEQREWCNTWPNFIRLTAKARNSLWPKKK